MKKCLAYLLIFALLAGSIICYADEVEDGEFEIILEDGEDHTENEPDIEIGEDGILFDETDEDISLDLSLSDIDNDENILMEDNIPSIENNLNNEIRTNTNTSNREKCPNSVFYSPLIDRHTSEPYGGFIPYREISESSNTYAHLAQDYWSENSDVMAIYTGTVYDYRNNYGPPKDGAGMYIILRHEIDGFEFFSEYQHLQSIEPQFLAKGKRVEGGEKIAQKGGSGFGISNHYNPHLHLIIVSGMSQVTQLWVKQFSKYTDEYGVVDIYRENQKSERPYLIKNSVTYYNPEKILNGEFVLGPRITHIGLMDKTVYASKNEMIEATFEPANAAYRVVKWSTSDASKCDVSDDGLLIPKEKGSVVISCKALDGSGKTASCTVTVTNFKLNKDKLDMYIGQTFTLEGWVGKTCVDCTFKSSNSKVVSVDKKTGIIKAKKQGEATITATSVVSKSTDSCDVIVHQKPTAANITEGKEKTLSIGDTMGLSVCFTPENALARVTYESSDSNVVRVISSENEKCIIRAQAEGSATITAKVGGFPDFSKKQKNPKINITVEFPKDHVTINDVTFPDKAFRNYVSKKYDLDGDEKLSSKERNAVKKLDVSGMRIGELKGIEYLTNLQTLECQQNNLKNLDVRYNKQLVCLTCYGNKIKSLDLSRNTKLKELYVGDCIDGGGGNLLTKLDLSQNKKLKILSCSFNKIKELDISKNVSLIEFRGNNNMLTKMTLGNNGKLETFIIPGNKIKKIDISGCTKLKENLMYAIITDSYWPNAITFWAGDDASGFVIDKNIQMISGGKVVYKSGEATSLSFKKKSMKVKIDECGYFGKMIATKPVGTVVSDGRWKSSNPEVLEVDEFDGWYSANQNGTVTVTYTSTKGKKASIKVIVKR